MTDHRRPPIDPLRVARGVLYGVIIGLAVWIVIVIVLTATVV